MAWCEANRVDYVFGLGRNRRLVERVDAALGGPSVTPHRGVATLPWLTKTIAARRACRSASLASELCLLRARVGKMRPCLRCAD